MSKKPLKARIKSVFMYNLWRKFGEKPLDERGIDYRYWKDSELSQYTYHPDIKIGFFRVLIGKEIYNIVGMEDKR